MAPVDLLEGYHAGFGASPGKLGLWLGRMLPPAHRLVGPCQIDEMPNKSHHTRAGR
ncbi:MAG: hypothetical protein LC721_11575 [Actinobacteria bacterium]|nr:hypothetical protein [Actinomycetota bacterium]